MRKLTFDEFQRMSHKAIAEHHEMDQHLWFAEVYTYTKVAEILMKNFNDNEFDKYSYEIYCDWYNKNHTKLGRALK